MYRILLILVLFSFSLPVFAQEQKETSVNNPVEIYTSLGLYYHFPVISQNPETGYPVSSLRGGISGGILFPLNKTLSVGPEIGFKYMSYSDSGAAIKKLDIPFRILFKPAVLSWFRPFAGAMLVCPTGSLSGGVLYSDIGIKWVFAGYGIETGFLIGKLIYARIGLFGEFSFSL